MRIKKHMVDGGWRQWRWLLAFAAVAVAALGIGGGAWAAPPGQSPEDGGILFQQKCVACHTVGQGDLVGPDLLGVTERRERQWLTRWLLAPDKMLAEGDPIATDILKKYNNIPMPNLGLIESEAASLIAYLEAVSGSAPSEKAGTVSEALPEGDAAVGKNLFTGASRFVSGGPSCRACHSIAGIGALGGGALGPDLTGTHSKLGDALITWPGSVAPMRAIYTEKPLTEQEKAHLLAFFESGLLGQRPAQVLWQLAGLAVGGVVVVLAVAGIVWRRRLMDVRRPMLAGGKRRSS